MNRQEEQAFTSSGTHSVAAGSDKRYKGVRRRKWGKWVSEIRVPGSRDRLWLGSFSTPEAAAVAHDTAVVLLRGPAAPSTKLNFPDRASVSLSTSTAISPRSVQRVASDSGMAVDAEMVMQRSETWPRNSGMAGGPEMMVRRSETWPRQSEWPEYGSGGLDAAGMWNGPDDGGEFLPGDISVDDMEIYM